MFKPNTPMILKNVTFDTEVVDDETRRVVACAFSIAPFTPALAEALNVRHFCFDSKGLPRPELDNAVLDVTIPNQRLSFAMAPDQGDPSLVLTDVAIENKLRVKVKRDRDPASVEAILKVDFYYPTAEDLLYIANGVNDQHFLTFEPQEPVMDFAGAAEGMSEPKAPRARRHAGNGAADEAHP